MNSEELTPEQERIAYACGWRKIQNGQRTGMWRYSGVHGTLLLADLSKPPIAETIEDMEYATAQLFRKLATA